MSVCVYCLLKDDRYSCCCVKIEPIDNAFRTDTESRANTFACVSPRCKACVCCCAGRDKRRRMVVLAFDQLGALLRDALHVARVFPRAHARHIGPPIHQPPSQTPAWSRTLQTPTEPTPTPHTFWAASFTLQQLQHTRRRSHLFVKPRVFVTTLPNKLPSLGT